jgi:flavoprotein hydroxylase
VGNALSILLAQLGHTVILLERYETPYGLPRAVHFDHEVGRILQACGIGHELRAISEPADLYEWRNGEGTTLLRFGQGGNGPSGWPASSMFNQPALEELLEQRAGSVGVETRRGFEVTTLAQHDDNVELRSAGGELVAAKFVVGCDGANSTVRTLSATPVTDLGFFYDWLIVDVILHEQRTFNPINLQICDPTRPTTAVSGGPGRRRWEFMRLPHESLDELNDVARAWELLAPWGVHAENAELERHAVYTFNARVADRWRDRRVFLAGDAAHLMPPFAGQGMCAGLRDAANLAWKLDHCLRGFAGTTLLESYQAERLPSARAAIDFSIELGKVICVPDPTEAAERDALMAVGVTDEPARAPGLPDLTSGFIHPSSPHAGRQILQGSIGGELVDEVVGNGWRLVAIGDDGEEVGATERTWFESLGGCVITLANPDEDFARWFAEHDTAYALQRPDFYLYGTATSGAQATALLADLCRDLMKGSTT